MSLNIFKYSNLISATLLTLTFVGCNDFLDREPLDQISQNTFWKTPEQLDSYIIGKYEWLPGSLTEWGMGYFGDDEYSDNMVNRLQHNTWMNGEENTTPTEGGEWKWEAIREINMFFDNYQKCEAPFESYKHTYGEACFLKAYKYHELVKKFGDVPWYSHVISENDEEELTKPRTPRAEVVDSIMSLIDKSIECLKTRAEVGPNRLNKETAYIYKSRVALFEATWSKYHAGTPFASNVDSKKYFQKVLDAYNGCKQLVGDYSKYIYSTGNPDIDYYNLFNRFDHTSIQEITLSKDYNQSLGILTNVNVLFWQYGYGGYSYTLDLINSYLSRTGKTIDIEDETAVKGKGAAYLTDLAEKLDPRFKQSVFVPGDLINSVTPGFKDSCFAVPQIHLSDPGRNISTGFSPKKGHNPEAPMENQVDPMISGIGFRMAELLLNYAEAYVELNNTYPDLSDNIDLLRKRVAMPTLTEVKPDVTDIWPDYGYPISDELAVIRNERRVELAGEGYRKDDWMRWRAHKLFDGKRPKGFRFTQSDYDPYNAVVTIPVDEKGYLDPLFKSLEGGVYHFNPERDYLSPIPLNDLLLNPNLKQNPGWDDAK
ncbi:putative uncharacterized protein [Parabacteroides sp. CAG:409]|nr:putative uncharacterized protein [Parabacteroides sp. CAG:409]